MSEQSASLRAARLALVDVEAFLEERRPWAFRLAKMIVASNELAEDVAQEAFIRAHRHRERLAAAESPTAWLRQVVVRCALSALEYRRMESPITDDQEISSPELAERLAVEATLARLDSKHRAILALAVGECLSYREIADALGIPMGTVASRLAAARAEFRRLWEEA